MKTQQCKNFIVIIILTLVGKIQSFACSCSEKATVAVCVKHADNEEKISLKKQNKAAFNKAIASCSNHIFTNEERSFICLNIFENYFANTKSVRNKHCVGSGMQLN